MKLQDLIGYLIHSNDLKMTNYFTKKLKPYNVTPEQWSIISILSKDIPITQKNLAKMLSKNQTTITRLIQLLERKELVEKVYNSTDKRSQNITLSKKGDELKEILIPIVKEANIHVTSNLNDKEVEYLKLLLQKLYRDKY